MVPLTCLLCSATAGARVSFPTFAPTLAPGPAPRSALRRICAPVLPRTQATIRALHISGAVRFSQPQAPTSIIGTVTTQPFIPVIAFDQFLGTKDLELRTQVARDLTHAFKASKFVHLAKHGVDQKLID